MSWHYFATRLHGDGTETLLATDLELRGVRITRALSGHGAIEGQVDVVVPRLVNDGRPVFEEWSTALYAERDGRQIIGAGILGEGGVSREGPRLSLHALGWTSYLDGLHFGGDRTWTEVDPADLVRYAWQYVQGKDGGNIGLTVDQTTTPVRFGTPPTDEDEDGDPVKWNLWSTHDLGAEVDRLIQTTPMAYRTTHAYRADGTIRHHLELGYPTLGRRRPDLRFVVGENVYLDPAVTGAPWASEVIVLGAGEGRQMKRAVATRPRGGRLRRSTVVVDKTLASKAACEREAAAELAWRSGGDDAHTIEVRDHPNAPLGSWSPGDEVLVQGDGESWAGGLRQWFRILADEINPETDTATLTVATTGRD